MKLLSSPYMLAVISIVYMIGTSVQKSYFPSVESSAVAIESSYSLVSEPEPCPEPRVEAPRRAEQPKTSVSLVNLNIPMTQPAATPRLVNNLTVENHDSNYISAGFTVKEEGRYHDEPVFDTNLK